MKRTKKVISIAVLISLVLSSCGRDGANLARRDDNNIAGGAVNQGANAIATSAVKQGNEWLETDGQVTNANGNIWTDGLQRTDIITADTSKSGSLTGTEGKEGELQNKHFPNVFSFHGSVGKEVDGNDKKTDERCYREIDDPRLWRGGKGDENWETELGTDAGREWLKTDAGQIWLTGMQAMRWLYSTAAGRHWREETLDGRAYMHRKCSEFIAMPGRENDTCWIYTAGIGDGAYGDGVRNETLPSLLTWYWELTTTAGKEFALKKAEKYTEKSNLEAFKECKKEKEENENENETNTYEKGSCHVEAIQPLGNTNEEQICDSEEIETLNFMYGPIGQMILASSPGLLWLSNIDQGKRYKRKRDAIIEMFGETPCGEKHNEWVKTTKDGQEYAARAENYSPCSTKMIIYNGKRITSEECRIITPQSSKIEWIEKQGEWYWQLYVKKKSETKEFFKGDKNLDWILRQDIGPLFMKTQTWLDILKAGVDDEFKGSPVGWLEFWRSDIFLKFADFDAGEKFWRENGLKFSKLEAGEIFWKNSGLGFAKTEAGKTFWLTHWLKFSKLEVGEKFWRENGLKFSKLEAGQIFWKNSGLDFAKTEVGEEFWKNNGLEFSGTEVGEKFWREDGLEFSGTEVGKEFLKNNKQKFLEMGAGKAFWNDLGFFERVKLWGWV